jgi:hypothetical protein
MASKEVSMKRWVIFASVVLAMLMAAAVSAQSTQANPTPSKASPPLSGSQMRSDNPTTLADCANGGWKMYPSQRFRNQRACERFVSKHTGANRTGGSSARTPGATAAPAASTPKPQGSTAPAPKTTPNPPQH